MSQPFEVARSNLYAKLYSFTFGKVVRDCKVVQDLKTNTPFFHGTVKSIKIGDDEPHNATVWFKKGGTPVCGFQLGPIVCDLPPEGSVPAIGDILMGTMVDDTRTIGERRGMHFRYVQWYPNMTALYTLSRILRLGTAKSEAQLSYDLRLTHGKHKDQVWAIARLVLFGNVQAFVDLFNEKPVARPMQLGSKADVFISECSYAFEDPALWLRFVELTHMDIQRPAKQPLVHYENIVPVTLNTMPLGSHVARGRIPNITGGVSFQPPQDTSVSEHCQAFTPPSTPPRRAYARNTIKRQEWSECQPVYQSVSVSPVYQPVSPVYQPVSPVYQPVTPPVSPVYQPVTPPRPHESEGGGASTPQGCDEYQPLSLVSANFLLQLLKGYCPNQLMTLQAPLPRLPPPPAPTEAYPLHRKRKQF